MTQAVYFCSGTNDEKLDHFGLAAEVYTHFTSPIRRYADVMVHRLLAASMEAAPLDPSLMNKNKVTDICDNINQRHYNAQQASRASQRLTTISYIKSYPDIIRADAYIYKVSRNALVFFIPSMAFQISYFTNEPEWVYDEENMTQTHVSTKTKLKCFDKLRLNLGIIDKSNEYRRGVESIEVKIVDPKIDEPIVEKVKRVIQEAKKQNKKTKNK